MTATDAAVEPRSAVPGTTTIALRALEHLAACLVREAAEVPQREVSVRLADAGGGLKVVVTVPVTVGATTAGSIGDRSSGLRRHVMTGMRDLAGREVVAVDVRYSGVRRVDKGRVR